MRPTDSAADAAETSIIHVEDEEVKVELHLDDIIAFAIFWGMGLVVFLQFFSRYVLNDSAAWTEEIARYLLMWVTFIGASIVSRRGTHIGVEVMMIMLPEPAQRALRFVIDLVTLGFVGLLFYFSILITDRMSLQRMTVIDWSIDIVYGGIALGCLLMLWRTGQRVLANARRGWRADPNAAAMAMD
jgi:TRAP-type C4-dicarboxylate transport system permease small subunit